MSRRRGKKHNNQATNKKKNINSHQRGNGKRELEGNGEKLAERKKHKRQTGANPKQNEQRRLLRKKEMLMGGKKSGQWAWRRRLGAKEAKTAKPSLKSQVQKKNGL